MPNIFLNDRRSQGKRKETAETEKERGLSLRKEGRELRPKSIYLPITVRPEVSENATVEKAAIKGMEEKKGVK